MKRARIIFIIIFLLLLVIPGASMPFFKNAVNSEKRELAKRPALFTADGMEKDFGEKFESWMADHIGFRNALITADNEVMNLFGQTSVKDVIVGNDGWLYFGKDLNDYCNVPTLSERNINNIAASYEMVNDYLAQKGSKFLISVVPNKSSLYDHMPSNYIKNKADGNYELLLSALREKGLNCTDLMRDFSSAEKELYLKEDTHWSYEGALFAYNSMMKQAGEEEHMLEGVEFEARNDKTGDLAQMLYAERAKLSEEYYPLMDFDYETISHEKAANSLFLATYCEKGAGNLVMYRDSYLDTMHVYCAESFENAVFSRTLPFDLSLADEYAADLTVLEIVERNIPELAERAPLMEAPEVTFSASAQKAGDGMISLKSEEKGGYIHFYGEIDEKLLSSSYEAYIYVGGDKAATYKAFPIYEKELLGKEKAGDNGFSAYIPADACDSDVHVIVVSGGNNYIN